MNEKGSTAYFYAGFAVFLWASAFPGVKYALNWFSPGALVLLRFLVASATMLAIAFIKKVRLPAKEDIPFALAGGIIGIFAYMICFNIGTSMVKSGVSSFIIATAPIFTLVFSAIFLKEKVRHSAVIGVVISAFGLLVIAVSQVREFALNAGILILLVAAALTSIYNIIQRKISFKYTPIECATYSMLPATLLMFVFLPELVRDFASAPPRASGVVIYLGVFPAALAYLCWNYALAKAKTTTSVTNFLYLSPFLATTLSYLFLGEVLSVLTLVGGATVICGMIVANFTPKEAKTAN